MNLLHQASHKRLFHHIRMNDWLGCLFIGFPLMTSLSAYTYAHRLHHAYLWNRDIDPKAMRYDELGLLPPTRHLPTFILRHLLAPLFLVHVPANLVAALNWRDEKRRETWCRYGFWLAILVLSIVTGTWLFLVLFWVVPYCTVFQIIRYLADMIDHAGLESRDPWLSTRTWEGSWVLRAILAPHSDNYHLTHHLFPLIPHYRFAQAHRLLMHVPEYAHAHHCRNILWSGDITVPSVMKDILAPERLPMGIEGVPNVV
jgi:fatty acid desaturase